MQAAKETRELLINSIDEIPVFPFVASKLIKILGNSRTNVKDVMHLISMDQSLSLRVLQLANSAYYGLAREIDTIHRAVVVLGFNSIISLAISSVAGKMFTKNKPSPHLPAKDLWKHSMSTAICCKLIAKETGLFEKETAFIGGLLHDMGKLVESYHSQDNLCLIINLVKRRGLSFSSAEKKVLGIDHAELASVLLKIWNIPNHLVESIYYHHNPASSEELDSNILAYIINCSDFIVNEQGFKTCTELPHDPISKETMDFFNFSDEDLASFQEKCAQELEFASQFLELSNFS